MGVTTHTEKFHYKGFDVRVEFDVFIGKEVEEWYVYLNDCSLYTYQLPGAGGVLLGVESTQPVYNDDDDDVTDTENPKGSTWLRDPAKLGPRGGFVAAHDLVCGRTVCYSDVALGVLMSTPFAYIKPYIDFTLEQREKSQLPDVLVELRRAFADNG